MTDREVMQMALDVVQRYSKETPLGNQPHMIAQVAYECIEALRTALAKPSWEPVSWRNGYKAGYAQAQETDLAIPQKELVAFKEICVGKFVLRFYPSDTGWMCGISNETMEALRTALAQPEPAECDGGYCKECPKPLVKLKEMLEVQGRDGTWNYDSYFHGMYNGMEVMLAVLEGREPAFREAPEKWLSKKEWVGLTDAELAEFSDAKLGSYDLCLEVEAKLKEKNNG